jgi:hypothetical protein
MNNQKGGKVMRVLASIAAFVVLAGTAFGDDLYDGYITPSGYTYRAGYFYYGYNSQPYTRTLYSSPGYWSCGRYYPGTSYYTYSAYYAAPSYTPPVQAQTAASFDDKLLAIVAQNQEEQNKIAKLKALGINLTPQQIAPLLQSCQQQAGGYSSPYSMTGHAYQVVTPVVFGSTYNSNAALYGDTNLNQLYLLQSQAVGQAGRLFAEANGLFASNVQQAQSNAAELAKFKARADALIQFNQMLTAPATKQTGVIWQVAPATGGTAPGGTGPGTVVASDIKAQTLALWVASAKQSCVQCHTGPTPKGNFDLETYPAMPESERQKRVYPRLDPAAADTFRMPRGADGKALPPLDAATIQLWHTVQSPEQPGVPAAVKPMPYAPATKD